MTMSPRLGKFVLTAHVTFSVGWLGAVSVVLAIGVIGFVSRDVQTVRSAYIVMEPATRFVLIPLSLGSLLTGLVQSLGTRWGLLRHYWVLIKLLINVIATVILLMYTQTLSFFALVAAETQSDLNLLRTPSVVIHSGVAIILLLIATTLSVYKPRGMTRYGQRQQHQKRGQPDNAHRPRLS